MKLIPDEIESLGEMNKCLESIIISIITIGMNISRETKTQRKSPICRQNTNHTGANHKCFH